MALAFHHLHMSVDHQPPCPGCSTYLIEPYIRCVICGPPHLNICLHCFSKGWENSKHLSSHDYDIITNEFPVLDSAWSAKDETKLLDAIGDCGIGNWQDIANQVPGRSRHECEQHYTKIFVESSKPPFPEFPEEMKPSQSKAIPCRWSEDPVRPIRDSQKAIDMAGYHPARGDFNTEYDNYAECDLRDIYFHNEDDKLLTELKFAAVDIHQSRKKERQRRKKIIRDFGLINLAKQNLQERTHTEAVRSLINKLKPLARLHTPLAQDKLLEGLIYELDLKTEIDRLQEYRSNGIKNMIGARMYDRLKAKRAKREKTHHLNDVLATSQDPIACRQWLLRQALVDAGHSELLPILPCGGRKSAPPLDLTGFAGYEKLNEKERELCATVRIIPEAYFEYKRVFQNECERVGHLKLKQARNLIKIDVNKIRKLFDFLVREGLVNTS
ncbi:transcriptional adapter 2-alpha-like [Patiria miniata]|uniref:Transcriptional adapter n=1 Tax=Patiria miniata TaxID=46514 RepID=A0A914A880_PATMI|nr:transcriptional adapter 2-alpha-like [Patiria miniata]